MLDGPQHFKQVSNWGDHEETRKNDVYKMKRANKNKHSVIRIVQEDVLFDKFDWIGEIIKYIQKIQDDNIMQNIYICRKSEYVNHKYDMYEKFIHNSDLYVDDFE